MTWIPTFNSFQAEQAVTHLSRTSVRSRQWPRCREPIAALCFRKHAALTEPPKVGQQAGHPLFLDWRDGLLLKKTGVEVPAAPTVGTSSLTPPSEHLSPPHKCWGDLHMLPHQDFLWVLRTSIQISCFWASSLFLQLLISILKTC